MGPPGLLSLRGPGMFRLVIQADINIKINKVGWFDEKGINHRGVLNLYIHYRHCTVDRIRKSQEGSFGSNIEVAHY